MKDWSAMAYLQVRDFPEELHEQLKAQAKREHRSVSQQTIIAIQEHVAQAAVRAQNAAPFDDWSLQQRIARRHPGSNYLQRHQEILARIQATPKHVKRDISSEEALQIIREAREERDARFGL